MVPIERGGMDDFMVDQLKKLVLQGQMLTKQQALCLNDAPLHQLCQAADEIRRHFCADLFDICTIVSGKSGSCSENCQYCAQSAHFNVQGCQHYPLMDSQQILKEAVYNDESGVRRFSIVTPGRRLDKEEVAQVCQSFVLLKDKTTLHLCASHGLLDDEDFVALKQSGVSRYHNNLETGAAYFAKVCTTHTYDDKIRAIKSAQKAGLTVCSGGIIGMGESMGDRVDLALALRELGICSVPINVLNPIKGTPFGNLKPLDFEQVQRTIAIFRFLLPHAFIRLAGGRGLMPNGGVDLFLQGANAAITGDMLTTAGVSIASDMAWVTSHGYQIAK